MDQIAAAFQRQTRFEAATVTAVNDDGTLDTNTAGRGSDAAGAGKTSGERYQAGDRVITVNGAVLGRNPWVCE